MKNIVSGIEKEKQTTKKSQIALREEEILAFWGENKIFEKAEAKGKEEFVFYDGPPFATGLPHYGHILAGTIKDAIPRYQTMRGKKVFRRWGWDCHGLPVENVVEKELGLKIKKDIEALGIEKFNQAARKEVLRYTDDWKKIIPRMGRFVDMENAYSTMDPSYTESVWFAFKSLYEKDLIYQGFKSMHLCPRCETTLSNFEVAQGYKDISDLAVTVKFGLIDEPGTYLLVWTTTPWTLPGNMAVAVNPDIVYVKAEKDGTQFIIAKEKFSLLEEGFKIIEEIHGEDLVSKSYTPPFDYYEEKEIQNKGNAWKIYGASFVNLEAGTGVVHIAPAFGADDLELAIKEKIPIVHHVGIDGAFKKEISDFSGLQAKPKEDHQSSDVLIIKNLASRDLLFAKEKITHPYPSCWRCDTPLLNYAAISWFLNVPKIKDKLIRENKKIKWTPEHLGRGRFENILETAPDWAISRSRFWGAPLPVWQCDQCESRMVIGSFEELLKQTKTSGNTYFLMRHGEAEHNIKNTVSSSENDAISLTPKGEKDVDRAAGELKKEKIDYIFVSPFKRTRETAKRVAAELNIPDDRIFIDNRLFEIHAGVFDGKPVAQYHAFFSSWDEYFTKRPEGGETLSDLKQRVGEFLYDIEKKYSDKKILIITHEYPGWMLLAVAKGLTPKEALILRGKADDFPRTAEVKELHFKPLPHNQEYEFDVHRPYIDSVVFPCDCGGAFKRVREVFDCWFESGSMPYGQFHYPFDKKQFDPPHGLGYPADFIAEGLDQTRGWFYSMLVLGVALFGKSPYKRVIVNGLILGEDGQKMSKRLKNYPDPIDVVNRYGADALRYYLLSSPVVRSEDLNFSERGVDEAGKKIIARLENIFSFYELYKKESVAKPEKSPNVLDRWILSRFNELLSEMTEAMERYEIDKATRPILSFVDDLSTWYLRRSRDRFKGDNEADKNFARMTTSFVLREFSKLIAPFMPFTAEHLFLKLKKEGDQESVHLEDWPRGGTIDAPLLSLMAETRRVVSLGLEARAKAGIKVRQPLKSISLSNKNILKHKELTFLIAEELNVKEVIAAKGKEEVALDTSMTDELRREGLARDVIRDIQEKRKNLSLKPGDRITVTIHVFESAKIEQFREEIAHTVNAEKVIFKEGETPKPSVLIEKI
jgi:isoleucyl-tRNA synthetase